MVYEPEATAAIKLLLRRTLVLSEHYAAIYHNNHQSANN
jgi:hypothetical protein